MWKKDNLKIYTIFIYIIQNVEKRICGKKITQN